MRELMELRKPDLLAVPVATLLRDAILTGDLRPGDRLVERRLATQWNISRAPLREAIDQLAAEGLVVRYPHRGASVRQLSEQELNELFEVREMIEVTAARIAVRLASHDDLNRLRNLVASTKLDAAAKNLRDFSDKGLAFHDELVRLSKNATLVEIYDGVKLRFRRYQFLLASLPDLPRDSALEHERILEALCARDADAAETGVRKHLVHLVTRFVESEHFLAAQDGRPSTVDQKRKA